MSHLKEEAGLEIEKKVRSIMHGAMGIDQMKEKYEKCRKKFADAHRIIMAMLEKATKKSHSLGHLRDLLLRINFNEFYKV